jgi:hypothetical protein
MAQLVKTMAGLAIASVKTVNGLAIASVKTVAGLDNTAGGGPAAFSDDFNRADSDSLGANWTEAAGDADIFSNSYRISTGSFGVVTSVYNTSTGSLTQYVLITMVTAGTQYPWIVFRYTDASSPYYAFQLDGNNGNVSWYHYANAAASSGTQIGADVTLAGGAFSGQTLAMTITGTGAGTDIRLWKGVTGLPSAADTWNGDNTPDASWLATDPAGNAVDSGMLVGIGGQQGSADANRMDNFFGGGL